MKTEIIKRISAVALASAVALFAGCAPETGGVDGTGGITSGGFKQDGSVRVTDVNFTVVDETSRSEYEQLPLVTVIKNACESVVVLEVEKHDGSSSVCSGVVIGNSENSLRAEQIDSYVAVSHTSIIEAENVSVTAADGRVFSAENGTLSPVGSDPWTDICVLRARGNIKAALLFDEESAEAGEKIVAVGNLLGSGIKLSTGGIISAKYSASVGEGLSEDFYVTDAYCEKSGLGSGIFGENGGFLMGITVSRKEFENSDLTPFVPASTLKKVCSEIIKNPKGVVSGRYKLGLDVEDNRSSWGVTTGIAVKELDTDGCMYAGGDGLRTGDVILSFSIGEENYPVSGSAMHAEDFLELLYGLCRTLPVEVGDSIVFKINRQRTEAQIAIEIKQYNYFDYVA